ncbi:GNAT family N-acetyltransferase [Aurantimonas sp. MSK8Z-1]|uniref:GNAT family N-acetyltransferase n=1 Tax=Mangrovibrevibacter kandeliae TaxID=2968473 RepID=UPI00211791CE|nr:GNAT family N-acetyltransferase [Aurantimonas sp. MSK8Z-1]MCW4115610.1 GNAT family N-acetyltransferase [Aurantimonas sp. MSK8Z-1]
MRLPDLHPGFSFRPLTASEEDRLLAFDAKRSALGPYITSHWGWDEALQDEIHRKHFIEKPFFGIWRGDHWLGTLSFQERSDHIRFGEFYLLPTFQRRGIGTAILRHCLSNADRYGLPVRLEHLHWNPVGSLYRRHGFKEIGRSQIHVFMERPVSSRNQAGNP